jgi:hypothetical protein
MTEQRETVGMATGGQPYQATGSACDPVDIPPTLAEAGIDKYLADTARKAAEVSVPVFEAHGGTMEDPPSDKPTLSQAGIDKHLADSSRKAEARGQAGRLRTHLLTSQPLPKQA